VLSVSEGARPLAAARSRSFLAVSAVLFPHGSHFAILRFTFETGLRKVLAGHGRYAAMGAFFLVFASMDWKLLRLGRGPNEKFDTGDMCCRIRADQRIGRRRSDFSVDRNQCWFAPAAASSRLRRSTTAFRAGLCVGGGVLVSGRTQAQEAHVQVA
jgi:hypothetical protein